MNYICYVVAMSVMTTNHFNDWNTKFKESSCCVCCDDFDHEFKPLNPCGHWIHETCVANSGKLKCPICRRKVVLSQNNNKLANEKKIQYRTEQASENYQDFLRAEAENEELEEAMYHEPIINNLNNLATTNWNWTELAINPI